MHGRSKGGQGVQKFHHHLQGLGTDQCGVKLKINNGHEMKFDLWDVSYIFKIQNLYSPWGCFVSIDSIIQTWFNTELFFFETLYLSYHLLVIMSEIFFWSYYLHVIIMELLSLSYYLWLIICELLPLIYYLWVIINSELLSPSYEL